MPDIEGIGIDGPDLGYAVVDLASGAEPLGHEPHAVFSHHQFDVVADRLGCDRIVRIIRHSIVLRRGGGRSQIVNDSDERFRPDFDHAEIERLEHRHQAIAGLLEILVADRLGRRHPDRDDDLVMPRMEGRVWRSGLPDERIEPPRPVPGNRLVHPALNVPWGEPRGDDPADARACKVEHLQAGTRWQAFREELTEDFPGALVGSDQRRNRKDKSLRACVEVQAGCRIVDPVGEPVGEHVDHELRAGFVGVLGIT